MSVPHSSVFTSRMPFLPPNQQRQSTDGIIRPITRIIKNTTSIIHCTQWTALIDLLIHLCLHNNTNSSPDRICVQELNDTIDQCLLCPPHRIINGCVCQRCLHVNRHIFHYATQTSASQSQATQLLQQQLISSSTKFHANMLSNT